MALPLTNTFLQTAKPSPSFIPIKVKSGGEKVNCIRPQWSCRKKEIHPDFFEDAKVYCNGEQVMTTGGTQQEYVVDVWSGNHPFYLGSRTGVMVDADQVSKFRKKFGELTYGGESIMDIPVLKYGEIILPTKRKAAVDQSTKTMPLVEA